ncbi:MAG: amidophosphoribosyltransferase [Elusimicrobia bacterium RIFOXYD2_FULL_34_15]|nr:MAG: amidophosphoribosyltransferase [Elusimicrobia bacterium RIFOXYD2_FULL_34_15]
MCGIFGVYNNTESAKLTYLGLYAVQHRGQESGGIISSDGKKFHSKLGMGQISEIFAKDDLNGLKGSNAIGHVRYSTAGSTSLLNAQPLAIKFIKGNLAIAHNGNLCNAGSLKEKLEEEGSIFQTSSDSEVILHLIAKSKKKNIEEKIADALSNVTGAYSLLFLLDNKIIAARDPYGFRPLCIGKLKNSFVISSETCALDIIGAQYVRDVEPGEIISFYNKKMHSIKFSQNKKRAFCIFEYIYFARPDSKVFGKSVYSIRKNLGKQLAKESPADADYVISVPDSANVAAVGLAEQSKIPYQIGFIRNHYIGRTFIEPKQEIRDFGAKIKYNPVPETLKGKKIILVDDSIVRGTTSRKLIRMLKHAGVKKIHHRISSPPIKCPCFYGIDTPQKTELIAANKSVEEIRKYIGVDTLSYLSIDGLVKATGMKKEDFCLACFNNDYPVEPPKKKNNGKC